ncbi:MAG: hypothetical protein EU544_00230 [Promethearchaeota archaeon]|nr:MAG: hypothetical protein EU544_00230 [Candidatus Lokiarchaeota archaeon]
MSLRKLGPILSQHVEHYFLISLFFNVSLFVVNFVYSLIFQNRLLGLILGIIFLVTVFLNLGAVILSDTYIKRYKKGRLGKWTDVLSYVYLIYLLLNTTFFIMLQFEIISWILNQIFFHILIGFSILYIYLNYTLRKKEEGAEILFKSKGIKALKITLSLFCGLVFFLMFFLLWGMLTGGPPLVGIGTGSIMNWTSGFFLFIIPTITILFLKLFTKRNHPKLRAGFLLLGIIFTSILTLPFTSVPFMTLDADQQFEKYFGEDWNNFDAEVEEKFTQFHWFLGEYYFGIPKIESNNFEVERDLLYSKTDEYELRYDAYIPKKDDLLGEDATIIYIHGGGWTEGDKNAHPELLRYLACQGYYIYDIQYRLADFSFASELAGIDTEISIGAPADEDLVGDWTIDDLISDIANFTRFLHLNNEFGANLKNVYFMGGSAGGYLAGMASFCFNEGYWNFSPWLNITGSILFFPPNDAEHFFYDLGIFYEKGFIPGDKTPKEDPDLYKKLTPSESVDKDDPPCLIFHGTSDSLVPYENSETIHKEMVDHEVPCILVKGYFGAHGHTEAAQHLSIARYYMERFLYLTK